jgi:hypothetical protein
MAGKAWADADIAGIENAKEIGVSMSEFSPEDQAAFAEIAGDIRGRVIDEVDAKGVDAEAAVALIEETMKSYGK